jgi:acyl carrier protein
MISVMFNVDCVQEPIVLEGISTVAKANPYCFSRFDLSLSAADSGGQLTIRCEFCDELFDRQTIENWLKHYELLLSAVAFNPLRRLGQFPQLQFIAKQTPSAETVAVARAAAATAPSSMSETEKKLADIWREVVMIDQVGKHDDFFDIGGHSLLATKVTARIAKVFAIDVPVRVIFEMPTIAELAQAVEHAQREQPKAAMPTIGRRSREADMQKLLGRLSQLSDAELQNLIQNTKATAP